MAVLLPVGVSRHPVSSARNVVQAAADNVRPLAVQRFSGTQSEDLFQALDETGAAFMRVDAAFRTVAPEGRFGLYPGLHPATNTLEVTGDAGAVIAFDARVISSGFAYANQEVQFGLYNPTAPTPVVRHFAFGAEGFLEGDGTLHDWDFNIYDYATGNQWLFIDGATGQTVLGLNTVGAGAGASVLVLPAAANAALPALAIQAIAGQSGPLQEWRNSSAVPQTKVAANGRDFILDTGTGTKWGTAANQKQAAFGATPAVQQTGGAATAGALYTATEQGMLQKAYDCLRTFGYLS